MRRGSRRFSTTVPSSTCRAGRSSARHVSIEPGVGGRGRSRGACRDRRARCCAFCRARRRFAARPRRWPPLVRKRCRSFRSTAASTPTSRSAPCARPAAARHPRDEHRGDDADGARRERGRRHRTAQGGALRCRARDRQPRDRAHVAGFGGSARRPRGPDAGRRRRSALGLRATGCGRIASRRSRASIWPRSCSTSSPGAAIRATLEWFEAPPAGALAAAFDLLKRLNALDEAGRMSNSEDLAGPLDAGVSGGPVLDGATGQVLGLMGPRQPDGQGTLVPAASIQAAMAAAGVEASPSKFDAVFRRGIDHLSSGMGGSAESALEESLTYFDSALATSYLEQARKMSSEHPMGDQATAAADAGKDGPLQAALLPGFAGFLLLAGILAVLVLRRGRASAARGVGGAPPRPADRSSSKGAEGRPVAPLKPQTGDSQTAMTRAARADEDQVLRQQAGHGGTGPVRTEAAGHKSSPPSQSPASGGRGQPASGATGDVNTGLNGGETRTAGPLAPRSAERQGRTFCSQCGRSVRPGARFCSSCGYPVG